MATTATRRKQIPAKPNSRTNEIIAVILLALAVLIFLCLISSNPMDPTFNTVSSQKIQNWIGVVGANFAEFLISIIGVTAYLLPALIVLMAWRVFRAKDLQLSLTQIFGYILFITAVSSLAALFGFQGGILGVFFEKIFFSLLGTIGTTILLFVFAITSLLLITSLSLVSFFGSFGMAFENFGIHFNEWLTRRSERSAARKAEIIEPLENLKEKPLAKVEKGKPTISLGDVVPKAETKSVNIRETVAALFEDLKKSPEKQKEKLPEKSEENLPSPENDEEISWDEIARTEQTNKIVPTISMPEVNNVEETDDEILEIPGESFTNENEFVDLVAEDGKIPITPVQQTGELDAELVEEIEVEKPIPQPKKPQNFDNYILPPTDFLTPATARIEQKDSELLSIAQELTDKTKEFNVTRARNAHLPRSGRHDLRIQTRSGRKIFARDRFSGRFVSRAQSRINPH